MRNAEMNKKGKADERQEEGGGVHMFHRLAGLMGYRSRTTKRERTHQAGMTLSRRLWSSQQGGDGAIAAFFGWIPGRAAPRTRISWKDMVKWP